MGITKKERKHVGECGVELQSLPPVKKKGKKKKKLMPEDNLAVCSRTASLCSENHERENHRRK